MFYLFTCTLYIYITFYILYCFFFLIYVKVVSLYCVVTVCNAAATLQFPSLGSIK